jgi:hypothetical protein
MQTIRSAQTIRISQAILIRQTIRISQTIRIRQTIRISQTIRIRQTIRIGANDSYQGTASAVPQSGLQTAALAADENRPNSWNPFLKRTIELQLALPTTTISRKTHDQG